MRIYIVPGMVPTRYIQSSTQSILSTFSPVFKSFTSISPASGSFLNFSCLPSSRKRLSIDLQILSTIVSTLAPYASPSSPFTETAMSHSAYIFPLSCHNDCIFSSMFEICASSSFSSAERHSFNNGLAPMPSLCTRLANVRWLPCKHTVTPLCKCIQLFLCVTIPPPVETTTLLYDATSANIALSVSRNAASPSSSNISCTFCLVICSINASVSK
mmetsp:Transcript_2324/g.7101  ORF Transcript_2324/g.7101 Transcript_2324/m.7101 type:complete len:215 (-) Transcript_2324:511-1155(-)